MNEGFEVLGGRMEGLDLYRRAEDRGSTCLRTRAFLVRGRRETLELHHMVAYPNQTL